MIENFTSNLFYSQRKKLNIHYRSLEIFVYKKVLEPDDQYILCEFKTHTQIKKLLV
jgi:hypothetical protein